MFAALRKAGATPAGTHALDSLRIERAYRHLDHDIAPSETPLEAGLGFTVKSDAKAFLGRDAYLRAGMPAPPGDRCSFGCRIRNPCCLPTVRSSRMTGRWARSPPSATGTCWAAPWTWATCLRTPPSAPCTIRPVPECGIPEEPCPDRNRSSVRPRPLFDPIRGHLNWSSLDFLKENQLPAVRLQRIVRTHEGA